MSNRVCPSSKYPSLESKFRKIFQNPVKIFSKYVKPGDKAADIGCGPGFFTIGLARIVGEKGCIYATDIQQEAINIINKKTKGTIYEKIIYPLKTENDSVCINDKVDFVLNFYVLHEVENKSKFVDEMKKLMKNEGTYMLVEPKGHVNKNQFDEEIKIIKSAGFSLIESPKIFFSRAAVFKLI